MIFDIADEILQDTEIIKVIDGIAGSAKSTNIDTYFKGLYSRYTSTVRLMKDAIRRFDCPCDTVAGGLFKTIDGIFFSEEREPEAEVIVIDEILQTSPKVLEWILRHRGEKNIIITTDSRQMLPKGGGDIFLKRFDEFCKSPAVFYKRLEYSYRPINEETRKLYNDLYNLVGDNKVNAFELYKKQFDTMHYSELDMSMSSIYLTHTNAIEKRFYMDANIYHRDDVELIPKGQIAKRSYNAETYPILCQEQAEKTKASNYLQAANIGSVTRYQGSEVEPEQNCYFIIEPKSRVTNREFYTALTRCKDAKSFKIVVIDDMDNFKLKTFCGYKIKEKGILWTQEGEISVKDGVANEKEVKALAIEKSKKSDEFFYASDIVYINGKKYKVCPDSDETVNRRLSINSLLKKDPDFDFNFMERVYKVLDELDIDRIEAPHMQAMNSRSKDEYKFQLDFMAAYPHIMKFGKLPIAGQIYEEYDPEKLNFYYMPEGYFARCIITEDLKNMCIKLHKNANNDFIFLFGTDYKIGSKIGDILMTEVMKSVESKKGVKSVHWGFLERPYISLGLKEGFSDFQCVRCEYYTRELLMVSILSTLDAMILDMSKDFEDVRYCVDAFFFDKRPEGIEWDDLKAMYKGYDFRVKTKDDEVIYKTYEDLATKAELKRAKEREKKRRQRARKKAEC